MCLCNKINKENNNYLDYYLIRDKYYELRKANTISIKRSSTPYINPYTLEQMTSSDRYLDGYEPTKYSVLIDTRYEDPIVNIIPKELFFTEGKYVYYGEEYIFAINTTYETHTDNVNYYASRVVVFDIDITDPRNSMAITSNDVGIESGFTYIDGYNIFIDMPVMEVYVGIVNNNSKFQSSYHVDDSQDKVVIEQGAFLAGYGIDQSPLPIYMDLEYMVGELKGADSNFNSNWLSFKSLDYIVDNDLYNLELEDKSSLGDEITGQIFDSIVSTGLSALLLALKCNFWVSSAIQLLFNIAKVLNEYNAVEKDTVTRIPRYTRDLYKFYANIAQETKLCHSFLTCFPNSINEIVASGVYDYSFKIAIEMHTEQSALNDIFESQKYKYSKCDISIAFRGALYDYLGNELDYVSLGNSSAYSNNELNDNQFILEHTSSQYSYYDLKENNSTSFTTSYTKEIKTNVFKMSSKSLVLYTFNNNVEVNVYDYFGRLVASSNNGYFNANKLLVNFEANEKYFVSVNFLDESIGNIRIYSSLPDTISYSFSYNNQTPSTRVFKEENDYNQKTYEFYTNSYQDTKILIYSEKGAILAYNDDGFYDPNEDDSDYNSALLYHFNRGETIYIFLYADGNTPYNKEIILYKALR